MMRSVTPLESFSYEGGGAVHQAYALSGWLDAPCPHHNAYRRTDMLNEKKLNVSGWCYFLSWFYWGIFLTGCTSAEQKKEYRDAQVSVISTQVDARAKETSADAAARIALYAQWLRWLKARRSSADAIAVALAILSVQEESDSNMPVVQLHREQNEAIEVVKRRCTSTILPRLEQSQ